MFRKYLTHETVARKNNLTHIICTNNSVSFLPNCEKRDTTRGTLVAPTFFGKFFCQKHEKTSAAEKKRFHRVLDRVKRYEFFVKKFRIFRYIFNGAKPVFVDF